LVFIIIYYFPFLFVLFREKINPNADKDEVIVFLRRQLAALENGVQMEKNVNKLLMSQITRTKDANSKLEKLMREQGEKMKILQSYFPESRFSHLQPQIMTPLIPNGNPIVRTPSGNRFEFYFI
jgi:hypothetical protein